MSVMNLSSVSYYGDWNVTVTNDYNHTTGKSDTDSAHVVHSQARIDNMRDIHWRVQISKPQGAANAAQPFSPKKTIAQLPINLFLVNPNAKNTAIHHLKEDKSKENMVNRKSEANMLNQGF